MRIAAPVLLALVLAAPPALAAQMYDLTTDWSDVANPNGSWCLREGGNALPHVSAWQGLAGDFTQAQPAWARFPVGTSNLPCFFRSSATVGIAHDWLDGDVVCHTTDDGNGIGSGAANVTWTSPAAGTIAVTGAAWMGRDIGRGNHWSLALDGVALTSGDVASGDAYSRTNPMSFAAGSGGAGVLASLTVHAGSVLELDLTRTSVPGDYIALRLHVDLTPTAGVGEDVAAGALRLEQADANPVRGAVRFRYALPHAGPATLDVFDVRGRRIARLAHGATAAGVNAAEWNAHVPGGLYFAHLTVPGGSRTLRVVVAD
jgi:hypothetical protein